MRRALMQVLFILLAVNSILLGGYTYIAESQNSPHTRFIVKSYSPVLGCPGDTFGYISKMYVSVPDTYTVVTGWISETDVSNLGGYKIAHSKIGYKSIYERFTIPSLKSGNYLYVRRMHFKNLTSDSYSIGVTVSENC